MTIIGVAPATFGGTELFFHPDLYVTLAMTPEVDSEVTAKFRGDRSDRWLNVPGRLQRGVTVAATNAEVVALAAALIPARRAAMISPTVALREE